METSPTAHESQPSGADGLTYLVHSEYHGGGGSELTADLAANAGLVVTVGATSSSDFPRTTGDGLDASTPSGCSGCPLDATITVRDRGSFGVTWSRLLGGPGHDRATAVAASPTAVFVAGATGGGLPVTAGAGDTSFAGGATAERGDEDGFVCRLVATTGAIEWCTYVGGTGPGGVTDLALNDPASPSALYVTLVTAAGEDLHLDADYAAAFAGRHRSAAAGADGVLLQLDASDGSFVAATYVGGSGDEGGSPAVAVGGTSIYYLGGTASDDAPVPGGWLTAAPAGRNLYLARYAAGLTSLGYATYVGGAGDDDATGNALVAGDQWSVLVGISTTSSDLPASPSAIRASYGGDGDPACGNGDGWIGGFFTEVTGADSLSYATYLGGSEGDSIGGISLFDGSRGLVLAVTGATASTDFPTASGYMPTVPGPFCSPSRPTTDAFVTHIGLGTRDFASTYHGGAGAERGTAIAGWLVAGETTSTNFPVVGDSTLHGTDDGFITQLAATPPVADGDQGPGPGDDDGGGCCGTSRGAPGGALALAGLVMLLVRRRRGR